MIHFRINMAPRGQGRPRARAFAGHASVYKAGKDRVHETTIASLSAQHQPVIPIDYAVQLDIVVITPRPAGLNHISKRTGQLTGNIERTWNTSKPDADNYAKAVMDALAAFWIDDKLVVDLRVVKVVAAYNESPGFEITIRHAGVVVGTLLDTTLSVSEVF